MEDFFSGDLIDTSSDISPGTLLRKSMNKRDSPIFNFDQIVVATEKFNPGNKIGEGGFGPVYKVSKLATK